MRSSAGNRIVVGYDGSPRSLRAIRWAVDEARTLGCELELVLVYDDSVPTMSFGLSTADSLPSQRAITRRARETVHAAVQRLAVPGLPVTGVAVAGRPGPALVDVSADARMLVIGGSHHSPMGRVLGGSTVAHCQRHARCPVVVVPAAGPVKHEQRARATTSG